VLATKHLSCCNLGLNRAVGEAIESVNGFRWSYSDDRRLSLPRSRSRKAHAVQIRGCRLPRPPQRSIIAPRRNMVTSSSQFAMSWMPIGRFSELKP
jgi:hypothetical protein